MRSNPNPLFLFMFLIGIVLNLQAEQPTSTYSNPIINEYLADPSILFEDGFYYLVATGGAADGNKIPLYKSKDLANWEFVRGVVVPSKDKNNWNFWNFWAPELYKIGDKFYLYYSVCNGIDKQMHVSLAIATKVEGPYTPYGVIIKNPSIDGHLFIDDDQKKYLYYTGVIDSAGLNSGVIYMQEMETPLKPKPGVKKIIWQNAWQEGPIMLKHESKYYLTYSLGAWADSTYHVAYSVASSPLGPFQFKTTILESTDKVRGPGHHAFFNDKNNQLWMVYHGWDPAYAKRYPRLDRTGYAGDELFVNGPSSTPQPLINGDLKPQVKRAKKEKVSFVSYFVSRTAAPVPDVSGPENQVAWNRAVRYPFSFNQLDSNNQCLPNQADFSGSFRLLHSKNRLYGLIERKDDTIVTNDPALYNNDNIELIFRSGEIIRQITAKVSGQWNTEWEMESKIVWSKNGRIVQFMLELPESLFFPDGTLLFSIAISDNDGKGRKTQLYPFPGNNTTYRGYGFGVLTLE